MPMLHAGRWTRLRALLNYLAQDRDGQLAGNLAAMELLSSGFDHECQHRPRGPNYRFGRRLGALPFVFIAPQASVAAVRLGV
jgi:hypothetical protein